MFFKLFLIQIFFFNFLDGEGARNTEFLFK